MVRSALYTLDSKELMANNDMYNEVKENVDTLLTKEMDRKAFLQHVGMALIGIVGITSVITAISRMAHFTPSVSKGYGASPYGGDSSKN